MAPELIVLTPVVTTNFRLIACVITVIIFTVLCYFQSGKAQRLIMFTAIESFERLAICCQNY